MADKSPPRRRVSNQYRVKEFVGAGGFGTVWRAIDEDGGPDVAVKFPRNDGSSSNSASSIRTRFRNACELANRLDSAILPTAIVRVIESRSQDPMYLVMEFVTGDNLSSRLNAGIDMPGIETTRRYGIPVVRALGFFHQNGVSYLDCKPENVLVRDRSNRPALTDFNTAELSSTTDTLFYNDPYKAPEQTPPDEGETYSGFRADVYGAAKLLCLLLTGSVPSNNETPFHGIDVCEYGADPPADIRHLIRRATSTDPSQRPADCTELLAVLRDVFGIDTAVAELQDTRGEMVCPVRSGDTIGRVAVDGDLPDVAVADPQRYVSPVHLMLKRENDGWLVRDQSLNGTYINAGDGWQRLLSKEGYDRLCRESPDAAPDEQLYRASRVHQEVQLAPVDPSYLRMTFKPTHGGSASTRH